MFEYVMGSWGARLERILSIGGDEGLSKPKEGNKANRFKPVVKFLGPFHIGKGESKTHSFVLPQYVGSVRTMVIAGEDGAYGFAEKATPVRKPLMVLATLPRILGPGETAEVPVTVFALESHVKDVNVEISPGEIFTAEGKKSATVHFKTTGDELVSFKLKVKPLTGIGKVKITATSGNEKAETFVELNVMNRNPKIVTVTDTVLETGESWNAIYKAVGISGTNKATLELSSMPPLNLGKRLDYLIHYPYGCIEQTTSSVFPQLYLSDLMDLPSDKKSRIDQNIKSGINRLKTFVLPSGAFAYWPGESMENEWGTNYAGHFLLEAELKGFSLPPGVIENWKKYQRNKATAWVTNVNESGLTQAYRLYTLALAKSPEAGTMNRLRENKNMSVSARWMLAAAYALSGQPEIANQIIENLSTEIKNYSELSGTYGSDERDESIILETLTLLGKRTIANAVAKEISKSLCNSEWMSTQTTAYCLLAMSKYTGRTAVKRELNFSYTINGGTTQNVNVNALIKQVEIKMNGTSGGKAHIKNNSQGIMYARIISEGIPSTDDQTSSQSNLVMKVAYKDAAGIEIDPAALRQGTNFYAEVTVSNPGLRGDYEEMALRQNFPSGWEIMNSRMDNSENSTRASKPRYQDIRDDRVYTFFDLKAHESKTFRIDLNASYLGQYYLPAIYAEAMYDASINARTAGKWIKISSDR
jgi:alpha-2-macroglobulin